MKKSLVKLAALSSAAFVLAGTVTPIVVNQVAAQEEVVREKGPEEEDKIVYGAAALEGKVKYILGADGEYHLSLEGGVLPSPAEIQEARRAAVAAAKEAGKDTDLLLQPIYRANTVEGIQAYVAELIPTTEEPETQEIKVNIYIGDAEEPIVKHVEAKDKAAALESIKAEYPGKTVTDTGFGPANELTVRVTGDSKPEETAEPKPETPVEKGYKTKEEAEAAAKKALENDPINNAFEVSQGADGRYYYRLFVDSAVAPETPEKPEKPEKPETPEKPEETVDPLLAGYKTAEDAIKAAEALLEKMPWNNGYDIQQGADGLFYIRLTTDGTKTVNRKPVEATTEEKKEEKKEDKKEKLPETGEVSSFAIFGGAALSVLAGLGLVASKKEEN